MKLSIIKDINGQEYLGLIFPKNCIDKNISVQNVCNVLYPLLFMANIKIDNFEILNDNLLHRNHDTYHITLFNVAECNKDKSLLKLEGEIINDIKFTGIGSISKNDDVTYFICVLSKQMNILRKNNNLSEKDLHITIGFNNKDLFHMRKNIPNIYPK